MYLMSKQEIKRRSFGRTGLHVTELGFGAMNLRLLDTLDEAYEIVNYVLDQGVNLIDTARAYNGQNKQGTLVESEVIVGNTIRQRTDLSEPVVVVTKGHGYTMEALEEDLNTSLRKLGISGKGDLTIGSNPVKLVYFFHGINQQRWDTMRKSGVLERAQALREQGVVNYIGFSSHYANVPEIKEALDTGIFDVIELPYNIFNRSLGEDGAFNVLAYAYEKQVGIINMKAFGGNSTPAIYNILRDYVSIDYSTMLNFCLANPYISTVDAGARYVSEFREDVETALGPRLSPQQIADLKQEADKVAPLMRHVCRECLHCTEKFSCPQEVDFPQILAVYSRYTISQSLGRDTSEFVAQYRELEENAQNCVECGDCLQWCEYKLKIPELIRKAREMLAS